MRDHSDLRPRFAHVCMPPWQIRAKCPSLERFVLLGEAEYAPVQISTQELGHIEVSRVIGEPKQLLGRILQTLRRIFFVAGSSRSLTQPRIDDIQLERTLDSLHEAPHCCKPENALMLDACGLVARHVPHEN